MGGHDLHHNYQNRMSNHIGTSSKNLEKTRGVLQRNNPTAKIKTRIIYIHLKHHIDLLIIQYEIIIILSLPNLPLTLTRQRLITQHVSTKIL